MLWFNSEQSLSKEEGGSDELLSMHMADALIWWLISKDFWVVYA